MKITKSMAATVATAAIAGASAALLFAPAIGSAQQSDEETTEETTPDTTEETTPDTTEETTPDATEPSGECDGPGFHGHRGARLETAAEAIGIEPEALFDAMADGQTIAEVAEANGVDPSEVIAAMVAEAETRLDEAVADEKITAERADEIRADLEGNITDFVNGELPDRPRPGPFARLRDFGGFGESDDSDDDVAEESALTAINV